MPKPAAATASTILIVHTRRRKLVQLALKRFRQPQPIRCVGEAHVDLTIAREACQSRENEHGQHARTRTQSASTDWH